MLPIPTTSLHSSALIAPPESFSGGSLPQNHQLCSGRAYLEMPIEEPQDPALSNGSPISRTLTISPRDIVTIAK